MYNISCRSQNINDVGDEEQVDSLLRNLRLENEKEVELDLSQCMIDYPATSTLIDYILKHLSQISGDKVFIIILDYDLPKQTLLNWLFLGSTFFGIEKDKEMTTKSIEQIILSKIIEKNITLIIKIKYKTGVKETDEFNYGK